MRKLLFAVLGTVLILGVGATQAAAQEHEHEMTSMEYSLDIGKGERATVCFETSAQTLMSIMEPGTTTEGDVWTNTDPNCADDAVQTVFNNSAGGETDVSFTIQNTGDCPVLVTPAPQRGDNSGGTPQYIPTGANERVNVTVPAKFYLNVTCLLVEDRCEWKITNMSP